MTKLNAKGFTFFDIAFVAALIIAVGLVGYKVYGTKQATKISQPQTQDIKEASELETVEKEMDGEQLDLTTEDEAALESDLADF